jgi:hypothetical protein
MKNKKQIKTLNDIESAINILLSYVKKYRDGLRLNDDVYQSSNRAGLKRMSLEVYKQIINLFKN